MFPGGFEVSRRIFFRGDMTPYESSTGLAASEDSEPLPISESVTITENQTIALKLPSIKCSDITCGISIQVDHAHRINATVNEVVVIISMTKPAYTVV